MHLLLFSFVILVSITLASADRCGGNCPTNTCRTCPCGTKSNPVDVKIWCAQFNGWDQACCQCIVEKESSGNSNAAYYNGWKRGYDVGLWQINQYYNWASCNNGKAPCDVNANLECAKQVWRAGGKSFRLWATAKSCDC